MTVTTESFRLETTRWEDQTWIRERLAEFVVPHKTHHDRIVGDRMVSLDRVTWMQHRDGHTTPYRSVSYRITTERDSYNIFSRKKAFEFFQGLVLQLLSKFKEGEIGNVQHAV